MPALPTTEPAAPMTTLRSRVMKFVTVVIACYAAWIGMLVTHELGHMLGAWLSGGRVISISIPVVGFSQTIVHPNPHERFVVWCGPIVGVLLPGVLLLFKRAARTFIGFFVGFCLIANGSYIGLGWLRRAGDAGDLVRLGTPVWLMVAFGIVCTAAGLACWHRTPGLTARKR